jgi:hypothetical protein
MDMHPDYTLPPTHETTPFDLIRAVQAQADGSPLKPMVAIDPLRRATAAQMLVKLFDGKGLTTPRDTVTALEPDNSEAPIELLLAAQAAIWPGGQPGIEYPQPYDHQHA